MPSFMVVNYRCRYTGTGTGTVLSFKPDIKFFGWRMQIQEAKIVTNERKEEGISSHDQLKVKQANFKI